MIDALQTLYCQWTGRSPDAIVPLGADGSARRYFRLSGNGSTVIGAWNADKRENEAFVALTRHFRRHELPVPELYAENLDQNVYLQQDLGDTTLFSEVTRIRNEEGFSEQIINRYRQVLAVLPRFQIVAGRDVDYSICYPRRRFDAQSMRWDLNYFKYHFLKLAGIPFDEQALEDDFDRLIAFLEQADTSHFLYRDCQSRNIMCVGEDAYFIDYQGGRQGALQYDVASLLQDGRANIPWDIREALLDHYIETVADYHTVDRGVFIAQYYGYALIRLMQAMGAYGFRGMYQGKNHFLMSIPHAVLNLEGLLSRWKDRVSLPALETVWERIAASESLRQYSQPSGPGLTVHVVSFSYKYGLPRDRSGHGGGYVFDCRILPNPGRYPEYAALTGRDTPVIAYLDQQPDVSTFLRKTLDLVDQAVSHHQSRGFSDLTVAFGCTGGQHRSVYCAEGLARHLGQREGIRTKLMHRELSDR